MTLWGMLSELHDMVLSDEIHNAGCDHEEPSMTDETCPVCFIENTFEHSSEETLEEDTTERQRDFIYYLHMKHADGEDITWSEFQEMEGV